MGKSWAFALVCASAGALAVPLHAVGSPVSAVVPDSSVYLAYACGAGHICRVPRRPARFTEAVHLPAWSAMGPLSLGLALMVLTLNGLGGLVFGYVFVKHGIAAAMWAQRARIARCS